MKKVLRPVLLRLYTAAIILFLVLAFAIVLTQLVGMLFGQAVLIEGAYDLLARPSIVTAIVVGVLGYLYFNTEEANKDQEEEPV